MEVAQAISLSAKPTRRMHPKPSPGAVSSTLALILALVVSGCQSTRDVSVTYRLWHRQAGRQFNEPEVDSQIVLYQDARRGDVLVTYNEGSGSDSATRRRAFYLNANIQHLQEGTKPHFVRTNKAAGLQLVPSAPVGTPTSSLGPGLAVVLATNGPALSFTLVVNGVAAEELRLPAYRTGKGTVPNVLLTPLSVNG
jgi:hypothetical protein